MNITSKWNGGRNEGRVACMDHSNLRIMRGKVPSRVSTIPLLCAPGTRLKIICETVQHVGNQIRFPRRSGRSSGKKKRKASDTRREVTLGQRAKGTRKNRAKQRRPIAQKDVIRRLSSHRLAAAVSGNNAKIWISVERGRIKAFSEASANFQRFPGKYASTKDRKSVV